MICWRTFCILCAFSIENWGWWVFGTLSDWIPRALVKIGWVLSKNQSWLGVNGRVQERQTNGTWTEWGMEEWSSGCYMSLSSQGLCGLFEESIFLATDDPVYRALRHMVWIYSSGFCFPEDLPGRLRSKCAEELLNECYSGHFSLRLGHIWHLV